MIQQDMLTTTPDALRDAIEQSVRGWTDSQPLWTYLSVDERAHITEDLTQHLFGNVVMALRFKPVPSGPRCEHGAYTDHVGCGNCMDNVSMYQGMQDAGMLRPDPD